jgi:hypothetical protein
VPTIKNVCAHPEDLHDGRALPAYETAEVTDKEFALGHYQTRIDSGMFLVVVGPIDETSDSDGSELEESAERVEAETTSEPEKPKPPRRRTKPKEAQQ